MTLRFISTEIWGDPWFEGLTAEEKMVFIYLFSNPHANQIGIAKITNKRIANETDVPREKVDSAMETLVASGKVVKEGDLVACMAFVPYQSRSGNFIQGAFKALSEMPDGIMKTAIMQQALKAQATAKERERKGDATPTQPRRKGDATPTQKGCNASTGQDSTRTGQGLKKETSIPSVETIPESLNTPEFLATWEEWQSFRTAKRNKLTPASAKKQLEMLSEYSPRDAAKILNNSIMNGWTGLFPEKVAQKQEQFREEPLELSL